MDWNSYSNHEQFCFALWGQKWLHCGGGGVVNLISQQQKLAIHGSRKNPLPLSLKNHFPYDGLNPN